MDKGKFLLVSWTRQGLESSQEIPVKPGTFSIIITNISPVGGPLVMVEGFPINPPLVAGANGESWVIGCPEGSVIGKSTVEIIFTTAAAGKVFVQQSYYTNFEG